MEVATALPVPQVIVRSVDGGHEIPVVHHYVYAGEAEPDNIKADLRIEIKDQSGAFEAVPLNPEHKISQCITSSTPAGEQPVLIVEGTFSQDEPLEDLGTLFGLLNSFVQRGKVVHSLLQRAQNDGLCDKDCVAASPSPLRVPDAAPKGVRARTLSSETPQTLQSDFKSLTKETKNITAEVEAGFQIPPATMTRRSPRTSPYRDRHSPQNSQRRASPIPRPSKLPITLAPGRKTPIGSRPRSSSAIGNGPIVAPVKKVMPPPKPSQSQKLAFDGEASTNSMGGSDVFQEHMSNIINGALTSMKGQLEELATAYIKSSVEPQEEEATGGDPSGHEDKPI